MSCYPLPLPLYVCVTLTLYVCVTLPLHVCVTWHAVKLGTSLLFIMFNGGQPGAVFRNKLHVCLTAALP